MRVGPLVLKRARRIHRLLPSLLPVCNGSIEQGLQELRWIQQERKNLKRAVYERGVLFKPLQYVLGTQPFGDLEIKCRKGTLIPRWETEEWCLRLISILKAGRKGAGWKIVDYCTGSGCIGLSLATSLAGSSVVAVEKSPEALQLCRQNHEKYKSAIEKKGSRFELVYGDVLDSSARARGPGGGEGEVDLVVANPPYVQDLSSADRSVRLHEPHMALLGDLEFYDAIFHHMMEMGAKGLVMEVGTQGQIDHVCGLASKAGLQAKGVADSAGNPRVVVVYGPEMGCLGAL